jgi:hypothetical protein
MLPPCSSLKCIGSEIWGSCNEDGHQKQGEGVEKRNLVLANGNRKKHGPYKGTLVYCEGGEWNNESRPFQGYNVVFWKNVKLHEEWTELALFWAPVFLMGSKF